MSFLFYANFSIDYFLKEIFHILHFFELIMSNYTIKDFILNLNLSCFIYRSKLEGFINTYNNKVKICQIIPIILPQIIQACTIRKTQIRLAKACLKIKVKSPNLMNLMSLTIHKMNKIKAIVFLILLEIMLIASTKYLNHNKKIFKAVKTKTFLIKYPITNL